MAHIPFGYKIENGSIIVDESQAEILNRIFDNYIRGMGLVASASVVGIKKTHSAVARLLTDERYLGTEVYPAIIDKDIFQKVANMRQEKAVALGRVRELTPDEAIVVPTEFKMPKGKKVSSDPFIQAEYAYSLIESVVTENE